jgi:hypothetical protein
MTDNLDEFLNTEPNAEAVEPTQQTPAEIEAPAETAETDEAKAERQRDEKGRFAPKGEKEAAPPATEEQGIPVKALQEERRKRQELEAQLAELQAHLYPPQPAPDMWEDTPGWQQHFGSEVVNAATQQAALNARLDMSEMMVAQSQPDFDEARPKILEFMAQNPALKDEILSDRHPWLKAYTIVKNHERMQELSATNVTELEAKLREQIKAELAPPAPSPEIPETLADAQSSRGSSAGALHVPTLDEILKR